MSTNKPAPQLPLPDDTDPSNPKMSVSALDFLLIELVPLAQRITQQLHDREQALIEEYQRSRMFNKTASKTPAGGTAQGQLQLSNAKSRIGEASVRDSATVTTTGVDTMTSLGFPAMDEETREGVFFRLDGLGYRVGQGLVERWVQSSPCAGE